jgi:hypothetical protein
MLTGIHFLLTYKCNMECDHCFVYSKPGSKGTFTIEQIRKVLDEAKKIGTIERIYFEGGEPFMFYPLMLEGLKLARKKGFDVGIVTNSYWATNIEDAELWLRPIAELGIVDLSISNDLFHFDDKDDNTAKNAETAAKRLGIPLGVICIDKPEVGTGDENSKGEPYIKGGVLLKGRAAEKLADDLPRTDTNKFTECPAEDLRNPKRVHIDTYGYVHLCQGLVMGNMWETQLSVLVKNYDPEEHPICAPLLEGGPLLLAEKYEIKLDDKYASACHLCYNVRKALLEKFPDALAPKQVYGID